MTPDWQAIFRKYISNHTKNKTLPKTIKLLIDQHKADLKASSDYYFDPAIPAKVCTFLSNIKIANDTLSKIQLQPFQVFIVFLLFGWRKVDDGTRRYTEVLYSVARKNGKSELFGAIILALCFIEQLENNNIYCIANSKDQIKGSIFSALGEMLKNTFAQFVTKKKIIVNQSFISIDDNIKIHPLADNSRTQDGLKPSYVVIDEYHESDDPNKLQVLRSGMSARQSPLLIITTTAGLSKKGDYYKYYLRANDSLNGKNRDNNSLYIIYELDYQDDIYDQNTWIKANPGLGTIKNPREMYNLARRSPFVPTEKSELLVKHLNRFETSGAKKYIDIDIFAKSFIEKLPDDIDILYSTMGLDLSLVDDMTAYSICVISRNYKPILINRIFTPEKYLEEKTKDNPEYNSWLEQGYIIRGGDVLDEDILFAHIQQDIDTFSVNHIGYDRWKSNTLIARLEQNYPDIVTKSIHQKTGMSEPIKSFASNVGNKKIQILDNPILLWMMENVIVYNNNGLIRLQKTSQGQKIDAIISMVMSWHMAQLATLTPPKVTKSKLSIDYM